MLPKLVGISLSDHDRRGEKYDSASSIRSRGIDSTAPA